ncbi:SprT-like domain-containing protein [Chromobacterium haemolyticum]|uniref:SprT-like domain-containing protein n=1 Tax=Chromobacterium haemolyticum TaxID=394935 RepID=UPI002449F76B|nr:SprT-like domain-containing protein [Chromobacterium haemolyticum]MDH0342098.1 SprT-like domain-containing protein [Chromobacterium haemolyticum]
MTKQRPTEEAYAELQQAYDFYNEELFEGKLPPCLITFQREKRTMGYFSSKRFVRKDGSQSTDEIALNPEYFAVVPMVEVLQTLVHEQSHLWQEHFGKPSRACYHNKEWADKMESVGLMPSDTGQPGGKRTGQSVGDYIIPDGRFYHVTKKLLASGFAITWLDRFPARTPQPSFSPGLLPPPAAGAWIDHTAEAEEESDDDGAGDSVEALLAAALTAPIKLQPGLEVHEREQENRSNRSKYECLSCTKVSVWGRPGLRVKCADCDVLLVEA